ncbi:ferritin-like domain-containing protein [Gordonia hydrophobica]|uniref:Ferritin-like domain-containing protein n=1 Tax=Gordonia hydrophobica TaxID=40516 RepID=A0ABZ2U0S1_9ACTN|nr:ferritin-like domain-containing protein [Gordonia hydrophobica]MBM7367614.1 rubrerythrin [Gordonia hydrophobica]
MSQNDALDAAADAENAAVFTYGVLTAFTTREVRTTVAEDIAAHRVRRDQLNEKLLDAGRDERTPAPGYTLPVEVTDQESAAKAAITAERDCETAYRALIEQASDASVRRIGVDGLTDCALRSSYWRGVAGATPRTVAFPGQ